MTPIRDVTPKEPGGFAQKAAAARRPDPEIVTAEVLPPEDEDQSAGHWTDGYVEFSDGEMGTLMFDEGATAFKAGKPVSSVPYAEGSIEAADWLTGWFGARRAAE